MSLKSVQTSKLKHMAADESKLFEGKKNRPLAENSENRII